MRKQICLLVLIVAYLFCAQSCMVFGYLTLRAFPTAKLSFNLSDINGTSSSFNDPVGAQVGFIYPVANFGDFMSLRPEINISMEGGKYNDNGLKGRVNLLYANVPLVLRYQTKSGFYGEAGVQPGFLLSAKDKYSGITEDYKAHVKKFDFGIPFGVGYEFKNNIGVGIRVIRGLSNINTEGIDKDHNFVVAIGGTYTFKKK